MRSPICWMGGKSRLRKEIIKRLPTHTCYVEVFGGAGWVLFGKEPSKIEVYNDIDSELVNFFNVIKNCKRSFINAFEWLLISRSTFCAFLKTNPEEMDEIQRAVRFFYIVKTSFGGKWCSPNYGYSRTKRSNLNLETLQETIKKAHDRLKRVNIESGTFEEIICRYDGCETFFYLDPPYYATSKYRHDMDINNYKRLKEILKTIKGKFLLTINDHEIMKQLWKSYHAEKVEVYYSVGKNFNSRKYFGELIVSNFNPEH